MPPLRWEFIKEKRKEKKRHRPRKKKTSFKKNRTKRRYRSPYQKGFKKKSKKTAIDQANVKVFRKKHEKPRDRKGFRIKKYGRYDERITDVKLGQCDNEFSNKHINYARDFSFSKRRNIFV